MNKIILKIDGMSCSACSMGLEKYLNKQKGVIHASVNLVLAQAFIEYDDNVTLEMLEQFIKEAGFSSLGVYHEEEKENNKKEVKIFLLYTVLAVLLLYISMAHMLGLPSIPFLDMRFYPISYSVCLFFLTLAFLVYGRDILRSGYKNLIHRTPNMDTLVSLGVLSSFVYSTFGLIQICLGKVGYVEYLYFESAAIVIFFLKLGRMIDKKSKEKTKEAIKELVQMTPSVALRKIGKKQQEVTIDEVNQNDILIAKPGMKIAVDGVVIKGSTHIDEAFITGESKPIKKEVGSSVIAGSINLDGYIEYKALKIGKNSTISEIVHLVIESVNTKAPIARFADQVSGYFVPFILALAFLTFIVYLCLKEQMSVALTAFVNVLVVACPCALGLATPLAIVIGEGVCAKNGILVKTSATLENVLKVDTIVFDKTGTLTYGTLKIDRLWNNSTLSDQKLLQKVASIEANSTHPISQAFTTYAKEHHLSFIEVKDFEDLPGMGISAVLENKKYNIGNQKLLLELELENPYQKEEEQLSRRKDSIVYVIEDAKVIGLIGVCDVVRESAHDAVSRLHKLKKNVIMLTGDNEITAKKIAKSVGIKEVIANVLPKEKTKVIQDLKKKGYLVMMVGDGINDAPALATADIGLSISGGTDIAIDSSDVILIQNDLRRIADLFQISKRTFQNIKQNLFWAFFYNLFMIPIAIGLLRPFSITLNPMIASFMMMLSSLTVILNALRLKRIKLGDRKNVK